MSRFEKMRLLNRGDAKEEQARSTRIDYTAQQRRNKRQDLIEEHRKINASDLSCNDSKIHNISSSSATYSVADMKRSENRRKLLESWRKKKEEEKKNQPKKPVFKVSHVDRSEIYKKNPDSKASTSQNHNKSSLKNSRIDATITQMNDIINKIHDFKTSNSKFEFKGKSETFKFDAKSYSGLKSYSSMVNIGSANKSNTSSTKDPATKVNRTFSMNRDRAMPPPPKPTTAATGPLTRSAARRAGVEVPKVNLPPPAPSSRSRFAKKEALTKITKRGAESDSCKMELEGVKHDETFEVNNDAVDPCVSRIETHHHEHEMHNVEKLANDCHNMSLDHVSNNHLMHSSPIHFKTAAAKIDSKTPVSESETMQMDVTKSIEGTPRTPIDAVPLEIAKETPDSCMINGDAEMKAIDDPGVKPETEEEKAKRLEMVLHFRNLVKSETNNLNNLSTTWNGLVDEAPDDNVKGDIRSAIGLAKLLIDERFDQFSELIDQCENLSGEKAVLWTDLQGFWEMIYFQVEDVFKKFKHLEKLREVNYDEEKLFAAPKKKAPVAAKPKPKPAAPKPAATGRSKFAEFKNRLMKQKIEQENGENVEPGVEVLDTKPKEEPQPAIIITPAVKSPAKTADVFVFNFEEPVLTTTTTSNKRKSMRKSVLRPTLSEIQEVIQELKAEQNSPLQLKSINKLHAEAKRRDSDLMGFETPSKPLPLSNKKLASSAKENLFDKILTNEPMDIKNTSSSNSFNTTARVADDFLGRNKFKPFNFASISSNQDQCMSPKTPSGKKLPSASGQNESPLFKLAVISSFGKRQSMNNNQKLNWD